MPGSDRFACPGCGKSYRWKPEIAAKKVRCAGCNLKVRVPAAAGRPAEALEPLPTQKDEGPSYDLAMDDLMPPAPGSDAITAGAPGATAGGAALPAASANGKCPSCNQKVKPGAVLCINCGFNLKDGKKLTTRVATEADAPNGPAGPRPAATAAPIGGGLMQMAGKRLDGDAVAADMEREHRFREKVLPAIVLGVGVGLMAVNGFLLGPAGMEASGANQTFTGTMTYGETVTYALIAEVLRLVIQLPTLFVGIMVVASLFGASFGPLMTAVLKLLAVAVVAGSADAATGYALDIATGGLGRMVGGMFQWSISVAVFWCLAMWLLETDVMETMVLWLITALLPVLAMLFFGTVIMSMFF